MGLPAAEEAVQAAEEQLSRVLPTALRQRLLRNNGGEVRVVIEGADDEWWQVHPVWDPSSKETMRRSANHIVKQQESAREWPSFPAEAISIADKDGDQLILRPGDDTVHLWLHETGDIEPVEVDWNEGIDRG